MAHGRMRVGVAKPADGGLMAAICASELQATSSTSPRRVKSEQGTHSTQEHVDEVCLRSDLLR